MTKQRLIRMRPSIPGKLIVRGGLLDDPSDLRADALRNFDWYAFYGVSVYAVSVNFDLDWVLERKLPRWETVTSLDSRDILASGLDLIPTGKAPHYDIAHASLDELVERLTALPRIVRHNEFNTLGEEQ